MSTKETKPKKTKEDKMIDDKIKFLKKFYENDKSNYINKGFFTNGFIFITDKLFEDIPDELRIIDSKKEYEKIEITKEQLNILENFKQIKFIEKKFNKKELKDFLSELKKLSLEQIQIINGKFRWFDNLGYHKFKCVGEGEIFKNIILDFNTEMFKNILGYFELNGSTEMTLYTNKTFLMMKSIDGITIYARGVNLTK